MHAYIIAASCDLYLVAQMALAHMLPYPMQTLANADADAGAMGALCLEGHRRRPFACDRIHDAAVEGERGSWHGAVTDTEVLGRKSVKLASLAKKVRHGLHDRRDCLNRLTDWRDI